MSFDLKFFWVFTLSPSEYWTYYQQKLSNGKVKPMTERTKKKIM